MKQTGQPEMEQAPAAPAHMIHGRVPLIVIGSALALLTVIASLSYAMTRPVILQVAVGPHGTEDVRVIQAMAQAFAREKKDVRLRPVITDGALASSAALTQGKVDLAVIRGDVAVPRNAQTVASVRKNVAVLWTIRPPEASSETSDEPITRISHLAGKRIGVIGRGQANVRLLEVILDQYGITESNIKTVDLQVTQIDEAARAHSVDAFLATGPVNSKRINEAIQASTRVGTPVFLAIDTADAIASRHPPFDASDIPAGSFGGSPERPPEAVKTISFHQHLVARSDVSNDTIATLTEQIFTARQALISEHPLAANITAPDTDKDAVIPVHPGAAAFIEGEQQSFLERYGDYIWWGLMALSGLGSVGAWFAAYRRRGESLSNNNRRDRVLQLIRVCRSATLTSELDNVQQEADELLGAALIEFDRGVISEAGLTALNVALDQLHHAVADRRGVLSAAPDLPSRMVLPRAVKHT